MAVFLYSGFLFWLSSLPASPEFVVYPDKILHFAAYFLYALLLWKALSGTSLVTQKWQSLIVVALIASGFAASDELHQSFVAGRNASIYDWFADVAGILGMLTLRIIRVKWRGDAVRYEPI